MPAKRITKKDEINKSKEDVKEEEVEMETEEVEKESEEEIKKKKKSVSKKVIEKKTTSKKTTDKKQKVTKPKKEEKEEDEEGEIKKPKTRHFTITYEGEEMTSRPSGKLPKQAANKALTAIIKKFNIDGSLIGKEINFSLTENGRNASKRIFNYIGIRSSINPDPEFYKNKKDGKQKEGLKLEFDKDNKVISISIPHKIMKDGIEEIRYITYRYTNKVKKAPVEKVKKSKVEKAKKTKEESDNESEEEEKVIKKPKVEKAKKPKVEKAKKPKVEKAKKTKEESDNESEEEEKVIKKPKKKTTTK
jgi:hypothetical protein